MERYPFVLVPTSFLAGLLNGRARRHQGPSCSWRRAIEPSLFRRAAGSGRGQVAHRRASWSPRLRVVGARAAGELMRVSRVGWVFLCCVHCHGEPVQSTSEGNYAGGGPVGGSKLCEDWADGASRDEQCETNSWNLLVQECEILQEEAADVGCKPEFKDCVRCQVRFGHRDESCMPIVPPSRGWSEGGCPSQCIRLDDCWMEVLYGF
jgi:hypothetical protein